MLGQLNPAPPEEYRELGRTAEAAETLGRVMACEHENQRGTAHANDDHYSKDQLIELSELLGHHQVVGTPLQELRSFVSALPWDTALAQLIYDSANDDHDAPALVRSRSTARELAFEGPGMSIEVEVGASYPARRGRCRILGQIIPAQEATVEVRSLSETFLVSVDTLGRFTVANAPEGPVSLRCTPVSGEAATETEWIVI